MPPKASDSEEEVRPESSENETVTEEAEADVARPKAKAAPAPAAPAPPSAAPPSSAVPKSPPEGPRPAASGRRKKARAPSSEDGASSSNSISEAPARGRSRSRDVVHAREPSPPREGFSSGKGRQQSRIRCEICWQPVSVYQSAQDQHRRWNLICLQWQRYNQGGVSWEQAGASAVRRKARRDARAIAEQAASVRSASVVKAAPPRMLSPSPDYETRPARSHREKKLITRCPRGAARRKRRKK